MRRTLTTLLPLLAACSGGVGTATPNPPSSTFLGLEIRHDTDPKGAADSVEPQVRVDGQRIHVVWTDDRNGVNELRYSGSFDGGKTWLIQDELIPDTAGAELFRRGFTYEGDNLYLTWDHDPLGNGEEDVFFNYSINGGLTWQPTSVRLDGGSPGTADADDPAIACSGQNVLVVWKDDRNGADDIYLNRSNDGGGSWHGEQRIDTDAAGQYDSRRHRIHIEGDRVYVLWTDDRFGAYDLFLRRSDDAGNTWWPSELRIEGHAPGLADSREPEMRASGDDIFVAWEDYRENGVTRNVYSNRSTDGGSTWEPADTRLDSAPPGMNLDSMTVARAGSNIYVIWEDERWAPAEAVYMNRSTDGGATWLASDFRIDDALGVVDIDGPELCAHGNHVVVVWEDERDGEDDVRLNWSLDQGATWQPSSVRADQDVPGVGDSDNPMAACSDSTVWIVWQDERNGLDDTYGNGGKLPQ